MITDARAETSRAAVLASLADAVLERSAEHKTHPARVGIDGPDGSGKTILRSELAAVLRERGADVIEATVDDFHYPQSIRYAMGRDSWEGYWAGAFDYAHLITDLLGPLGPRGNLNFRTRSHDLEADVPIDGGWLDASPDAILLVDGVLLQRRELIGSLEMVIYVDVPFEETYKRLAVRNGFPTDPGPAAICATPRRSATTCRRAARSSVRTSWWTTPIRPRPASSRSSQHQIPGPKSLLVAADSQANLLLTPHNHWPRADGIAVLGLSS